MVTDVFSSDALVASCTPKLIRGASRILFLNRNYKY